MHSNVQIHYKPCLPLESNDCKQIMQAASATLQNVEVILGDAHLIQTIFTSTSQWIVNLFVIRLDQFVATYENT